MDAPEDMIIECGYEFDLDDLSEFGEIIVKDACGADTTYNVTSDINQCNVGVITRSWRATDANGFSVDTQRIYIENQGSAVSPALCQGR